MNVIVPTGYTVPTSNSCTKYVDRLGIIQDRKPYCLPVSWAWMYGLTHK